MEPWTSFTLFGKSGTIYQFRRVPSPLPPQACVFLLTTVLGSTVKGGSWQFVEPEIGTVSSLSADWDSVITPARAAKTESDDVLVCFPESGDAKDAFADLVEGGATPLPR
ncbi:hypothetical protein LU298_16875 [Komagataeibacter intermedius]|uniref:Uncharacterized protein n=2 Tax=Komagataeibacter intermedius TaxID=66229 RepID=A0A0N1FI81_9PROT|nr:hypothetical protein [Komagataeibacter intermedius]KPH85102.1 hypothetical protein GLUCOINTEAF2_0201257 [Komagataeibacter intermedius AF2]MCF3638137.1 hypothetical protein [Komagataeibacter intermedius]GAN86784.1 hypothetical protein Gain_0034_021 [Komagataeibacter intermedius TF2]GBQ68716.1 hypothetical protein AA0521_1301 [Komagataeibacter intermedius NRIC 0521]